MYVIYPAEEVVTQSYGTHSLPRPRQRPTLDVLFGPPPPAPSRADLPSAPSPRPPRATSLPKTAPPEPADRAPASPTPSIERPAKVRERKANKLLKKFGRHEDNEFGKIVRTPAPDEFELPAPLPTPAFSRKNIFDRDFDALFEVANSPQFTAKIRVTTPEPDRRSDVSAVHFPSPATSSLSLLPPRPNSAPSPSPVSFRTSTPSPTPQRASFEGSNTKPKKVSFFRKLSRSKPDPEPMQPRTIMQQQSIDMALRELTHPAHNEQLKNQQQVTFKLVKTDADMTPADRGQNRENVLYQEEEIEPQSRQVQDEIQPQSGQDQDEIQLQSRQDQDEIQPQSGQEQDHHQPQSEQEIPDEIDPSEQTLDSETLQALGKIYKEKQKFGPNINGDLAKLWSPILKNGLGDDKQPMLDKYLVPNNCQLLQAPKLNSEIVATITDSIRNCDKKIEDEQQQLGQGLTALNKALSLLATNTGERVTIIKILSEASQILCDLHYSQTMTRKKLITPILDKKFLDLIKDTDRDEYLYGNDLSEKLKAMKYAQKSSQSIKKNVENFKPKKPAYSQGNFRGPPRYQQQKPFNRSGPKRQFDRNSNYKPRTYSQPKKSKPETKTPARK